MSLLDTSKGKGKGDGKSQKNTAMGSNSKFIAKPGKSNVVSKKPIKTGGTRGS